MVNLIGSADQQMATQAGNGMSATPQGVEAQQAMVDITTNNYQKAIESFFSHYCSYALTIYFQELKATKSVNPSADARIKMLRAGLDTGVFNEDGTMDIDFAELATQYWVRTVPGSLVEMEDEKQQRLLNEMFIPLSQAMPALAAAQDQDMLTHAAKAMQYIITRQIELSGSSSAKDIGMVLNGDIEAVDARDQRIAELEGTVHATSSEIGDLQLMNETALMQIQEQIAMLRETQGLIMDRLGVSNPGSAAPQGISSEQGLEEGLTSPSVSPASA
jgi:hypothetical protein